MSVLPSILIGTSTAGLLLAGSAFLSAPFGPILSMMPVLVMAWMRWSFPVASGWFLGTYLTGLALGRVLFDLQPGSWIFPEFLALGALYGAPILLEGRWRRSALELRGRNDAKEEDLQDLRGSEEGLRRENSLIEKRLRQIEHLYDVIREAGGSLNVQEMIELARESTERMFDLPHFIIAVLSEDGKRYEVRIASGCDEAFFRSFVVPMDSEGLAAGVAQEKSPLFAPSLEGHRYGALRSLGIRSFFVLPLLVQDRVIGFLCAYSQQEDLVDAEKFSDLQIFCNQISIGLQKSLLYEKVQKLSITDGLTKLYSHRHFKQRLEEELNMANRYHSSLVLLILDIDHFKHYNDTYGHVAGDQVLQEVARLLRNQSDPTHFAARYGGEEMVLIAPETKKDRGLELAERIRAAVEARSFSIGKQTTKVTVSIGVAAYPEDAQSNLDLIAKADQALYAAKSRGRNLVLPYEPGGGGKKH